MTGNIRLIVMLVASLAAIESLVADESVDAMLEPSISRPAATDQRVLRDRMDLESTSIRGNQELPRVLYIVPWKDSALGDVAGKPMNSLIDEVLAPLDRDVFLRQTNYFDQLYGVSAVDDLD